MYSSLNSGVTYVPNVGDIHSSSTQEGVFNFGQEGNKEIRERKAKSCRKATQSKEYRESQSKLMKKKISESPESFPRLFIGKKGVTDWMKKSNYERWVIRYGVEEADKRQENWHSKNILPSCSKNTKPEQMFASILVAINI